MKQSAQIRAYPANSISEVQDKASIESESRPGVRYLFLIFVYFVVASAAFGGYFTKWHFRDDAPEISLSSMLDGTAKRPFVYRQLLPMLANDIERGLPQHVKESIKSHLARDYPLHNPLALYYPSAVDAHNPKYEIRYYLVYGMAFAFFLFAMFALRSLCIELQVGEIASTLAPLAFASILPLLLTEGGYFYDLPEIFFMALAARYALQGKVGWLLLLTALGTLNKESFLFFILTLYPLLRISRSPKASITIECAMLLVAAALNAIIKLRYIHNSGGMLEVHLMENLRFLAHPLNYFRFEWNYGIPTTKGFNVINLAIVGLLVRGAWHKLTSAVRRHILVALVINVPLFLAFCMHDELRNLSMLDIGFVMIVAVNIASYLDRARRSEPHTIRHGVNMRS